MPGLEDLDDEVSRRRERSRSESASRASAGPQLSAYAAQARREGFQPVSTRITAKDKPGYFRGRPTIVELVVDRGTRRMLGATIIGEEGVAGRINVVATALTARLGIDDFEDLDLAYAPPFAPVWDPLLICAQQVSKLLP